MDIRNKVHIDAKKQKKLSWAWYETNVRNAAAGMSAQKFLSDNQAHQKDRIVPGDLVSFFYDPKTKEKLPYYDTFPMVLPFSATDTHFTALNLHYLHPRTRAALLQKLMTHVTDDKLSPRAKIAVDWQTLKNASQYPEVKDCVKQYLFSHVKSKFIVIPPKEFEFVIWLPLCRFKGATNEQVWSKK